MRRSVNLVSPHLFPARVRVLARDSLSPHLRKPGAHDRSIGGSVAPGNYRCFCIGGRH